MTPSHDMSTISSKLTFVAAKTAISCCCRRSCRRLLSLLELIIVDVVAM